jgi:acyl-CoA thioester hydrolase
LDETEIEIWRGGVNTWQCDQMGHLNVRFYMSHVMEGLAGLAAALGMERAFAPRAASTLVVSEHHIRFLKEARVGEALHMTGAVLEMAEDETRLVQTMLHSASGEPAAIFQSRAAHVTSGDVKAFPWPATARTKAQALTGTIPPALAPRSLTPGGAAAPKSLQDLDALDLKLHGAGAFGPQDCDVFGRARPDQIMGRISDGAAHSIAAMREVVGDIASGGRPIGVAVVEYRLIYQDWPGAGDRYEMRSGVVFGRPRLIRWAHFLNDPTTGRPWARAESVLVPFDLDLRKAITLPEPVVKALEALARPELAD